MFLFTYAAGVIATIFIVVGIAILTHRRTLLDIALAGYLLSSALWTGANAIADVSYTPFALTVSSQWGFCGAMASLFFVFLLVDVLIDERFPPLARLICYGLPCIALALAGFTSYGIVGLLFPPNQPALIVPGIVYSISIPFFIVGLLYGTVRLIQGLEKEPDLRRRMQFLYVLTSLLVVMFSQMIFDDLLPVLGQLQIFDWGPITSVLFVGSCFYAIAKYQLLDMRIVIQRGLIYTCTLGLIIGFYICLISTFNSFLHDSIKTDVFWSGIVTIVLGVIGVPLIEKWFRHISDPLFFKDTYDYGDAMQHVGELFQLRGDFDEILIQIETTLTNLLRATSVTIDLVDSSLGTDSPLHKSEALRIPIVLDAEEIGQITVGPKRSEEPYSTADLKFLRTFSLQAATAFSRIRLYKEVERYAEELEEKVQARTSELVNLQEEQRRTLIELSHNLQTPLTVFQTKISAILDKRPNDREVLDMKHSIHSLSLFIYDLLSLSSLERTLAEEEQAVFSLTDLLLDVYEEIQIITADTDIDISEKIEPGVAMYGNEKRIREALMNIGHNAVKYIGNDARKKILFTLEKSDSEPGESGSIVIMISDTGIGIHSSELSSIFERFYRVAPTADTSPVLGTGLGLSIVSQILKRHHATITVESSPGEGSNFIITLPPLDTIDASDFLVRT
jgi:signal transduction histidine kinase